MANIEFLTHQNKSCDSAQQIQREISENNIKKTGGIPKTGNVCNKRVEAREIPCYALENVSRIPNEGISH